MHAYIVYIVSIYCFMIFVHLLIIYIAHEVTVQGIYMKSCIIISNTMMNNTWQWSENMRNMKPCIPSPMIYKALAMNLLCKRYKIMHPISNDEKCIGDEVTMQVIQNHVFHLQWCTRYYKALVIRLLSSPIII